MEKPIAGANPPVENKPFADFFLARTVACFLFDFECLTPENRVIGPVEFPIYLTSYSWFKRRQARSTTVSDKTGRNGWPLVGGKEQVPPFAKSWFIECCQNVGPRRRPGVCLWLREGKYVTKFMITCEELGQLIKQLTQLIVKKFGKQSILKFRRKNPTGRPTGRKPRRATAEYRKITVGEPMVIAFTKQEEKRAERIRRLHVALTYWTELKPIAIGVGGLLLAETPANYFLLWLEQLHAACCI